MLFKILSRLWIRLRRMRLRRLARSIDFNASSKLILLHIPKTAGTSMYELFEQNYPNQCCLRKDGEFDGERWAASAVVGGHFKFSFFEDIGLLEGHIFISIIRDPVERALSRFQWYQRDEANKLYRESRGFDHTNILRTIRVSSYSEEFVGDLQCQYLSGHPYSLTTLIKMRESKSRFIIGTYDNLDALVDYLSTELGWEHSDLPTLNQRLPPFKSFEDEAFGQCIDQEKFDTETKSILCGMNKEDALLLEAITKHGVYDSFRLNDK